MQSMLPQRLRRFSVIEFNEFGGAADVSSKFCFTGCWPTRNGMY